MIEENKTEGQKLHIIPTTEGVSGRIKSCSLFKQYNSEGTEDINDWRRRFVNTLDLTEYQGAIELVGSWEAWKQFKKNWPSFQRLHLNAWLEEIEIRLRSTALLSLHKGAYSGDTSAAKFIAEGKYKEKSAGRPTNESIARETRIQSQVEKEIEEDLKRVRGDRYAID